MTNTLNDQLLENVRVEVEESEGWSVITTVPIPILPYSNPATTYTLVEMEDAGQGTGHTGMVLDYMELSSFSLPFSPHFPSLLSLLLPLNLCVFSEWDFSEYTQV